MQYLFHRVATLQSKLSSYDKQSTGQTVEQKILQDVTSKEPRSNKPSLIDVDLIRGSAFSKTKSGHGWLNAIVLGSLRSAFAPFYWDYWISHISPRWATFIMLHFFVQVFQGICFLLSNPNHTECSQDDVIVPFLLAVCLGILHTHITAFHGSSSIPSLPSHECEANFANRPNSLLRTTTESAPYLRRLQSPNVEFHYSQRFGVGDVHQQFAWPSSAAPIASNEESAPSTRLLQVVSEESALSDPNSVENIGQMNYHQHPPDRKNVLFHLHGDKQGVVERVAKNHVRDHDQATHADPPLRLTSVRNSKYVTRRRYASASAYLSSSMGHEADTEDSEIECKLNNPLSTAVSTSALVPYAGGPLTSISKPFLSTNLSAHSTIPCITMKCTSFLHENNFSVTHANSGDELNSPADRTIQQIFDSIPFTINKAANQSPPNVENPWAFLQHRQNGLLLPTRRRSSSIGLPISSFQSDSIFGPNLYHNGLLSVLNRSFHSCPLVSLCGGFRIPFMPGRISDWIYSSDVALSSDLSASSVVVAATHEQLNTRNYLNGESVRAVRVGVDANTKCQNDSSPDDPLPLKTNSPINCKPITNGLVTDPLSIDVSSCVHSEPPLQFSVEYNENGQNSSAKEMAATDTSPRANQPIVHHWNASNVFNRGECNEDTVTALNRRKAKFLQLFLRRASSGHHQPVSSPSKSHLKSTNVLPHSPPKLTACHDHLHKQQQQQCRGNTSHEIMQQHASRRVGKTKRNPPISKRLSHQTASETEFDRLDSDVGSDVDTSSGPDDVELRVLEAENRLPTTTVGQRFLPNNDTVSPPTCEPSAKLLAPALRRARYRLGCRTVPSAGTAAAMDLSEQSPSVRSTDSEVEPDGGEQSSKLGKKMSSSSSTSGDPSARAAVASMKPDISSSNAAHSEHDQQWSFPHPPPPSKFGEKFVTQTSVRDSSSTHGPTCASATVRCHVWDNEIVSKCDMTMLDIGCKVVRAVERQGITSDYLFLACVASILLPFMSVIFHRGSNVFFIYSKNNNNTICHPDNWTQDSLSTVGPLSDSLLAKHLSSLSHSFLLLWATATESMRDLMGFLTGTSVNSSASPLIYFVSCRWIGQWFQAPDLSGRLVFLLGTLLRFNLYAVIFFLLCITERTFQERLLYAKYFFSLTSARRARKYRVPQIRLNKLSHIKCWLTLRSYFRKHGPQRSVETIIAASFYIVFVFALILCAQLLSRKEGSVFAQLVNWDILALTVAMVIFLHRLIMLGMKITKKYRNLTVLITEQINLYLHMEQKPHKKDQLSATYQVLRLVEGLLKEVDGPFRVCGWAVNPFVYNIFKLVLLSCFSTLLSQMLGFKLKLYKLKLNAANW